MARIASVITQKKQSEGEQRMKEEADRLAKADDEEVNRDYFLEKATAISIRLGAINPGKLTYFRNVLMSFLEKKELDTIASAEAEIWRLRSTYPHMSVPEMLALQFPSLYPEGNSDMILYKHDSIAAATEREEVRISLVKEYAIANAGD